MSFQGVNINKLNGGLGRRNPSEDNVFALAYGMPLTGTTATLNTAHKLLQASDAEALGINAEFDSTNNVLAYNEIVDFFTYCPDGVLYLIPVDPTLKPSEVVAVAAFIQAVKDASDVRVLGIGNTVTEIADIADEVETVQTFVNNLATEYRYIDSVVLTAKGDATPVTISAFPDLRAKTASNVSVSIAQDPAVAALSASYANHAAIGAVLGMLAVRQVNENLGSVDILNKPTSFKGQQDYPLTIDGSTRWATASLSDGKAFASLSNTDQKALTDAGYIYAGSFDGYGGIFFNSAPTSVEKASDYAYIENNRVWNKAVRIIRTTLIPKVKGVVKKDPVTGFIKGTTVSYWQGLLNKALETMIIDNEISGFDFYINPEQALSENSPLNIVGQIVVDEIVFEFNVNLGLTDKI